MSNSKPKLRVLSLYDGISSGLIALKKLKFDIEVYMASEIDERALFISNNHFGTEVHQLGTIFEVFRENLEELGTINLLIGGLPCDNLSLQYHVVSDLNDIDGKGILFIDFYRTMNFFQMKRQETFYWIFEYDYHLKSRHRRRISQFLGTDYVILDSKNVSAHSRKRLIWSNIPGIKDLEKILEETNNEGPVLNDFVTNIHQRQANIAKCGLLNPIPDLLYTSSILDSRLKYPVRQNGIDSPLLIEEIEQILGFPINYTNINDITLEKRSQLLGKSWSIHILMKVFLPLTEVFQLLKV